MGDNESNNTQKESDVLVESLYKKNIELLVKNKTLSLLSKLYEISILALEPKDLAMRVTQTVQADLSFELVGILILDSKSETLTPLAFSKSERTKASLEKTNIGLESITIPSVFSQGFFKQVMESKKEMIVNDFDQIWKDLVEQSKLQLVISESNIKTTLLYPLTVENKVLGAIMLSINRNYDALSSFEKESIKSFVNVIALALEKALLYKELEDANAQLRELDKQKDELLSIVSHQLAAPITSFNWYLELLLEEGTERKKEELKEFLTSMRSIAKDLTELVGMILDVSRFQLGKMKVERQEVDMDAFFKEILDVIQPKAREKQQNFTVAVPQNLGKGSIDKRLSRMVVENLLTNAVKYTPDKGTVSFTVEKRNGVLFIEVKDTGVGIPKKDQAQIFGKLFRASNVHSINGNGFGLYIAKGAVESHGGHIRFVSEEGKGTTFFVELPV